MFILGLDADPDREGEGKHAPLLMDFDKDDERESEGEGDEHDQRTHASSSMFAHSPSMSKDKVQKGAIASQFTESLVSSAPSLRRIASSGIVDPGVTSYGFSSLYEYDNTVKSSRTWLANSDF
ncbi:hypothetical protein CVT25_000439 [Psilocybe cyanescens]|uniref:Uncharacterized protein n=1 Tax=Psilocybe cyanescens TaxID=93625 RepID=A0A409XM30_PSICY|nr:hypothetical protein CVT25_000439 [Psilocybe cyanescens]